jgi:hypothetical protein
MEIVMRENKAHNHFPIVTVVKKFSSEYCLLGCDAMYFGRQVPAFLMNLPVHSWQQVPAPRYTPSHSRRTSGSHKKLSADIVHNASLTDHTLIQFTPSQPMRVFIISIPCQILLE